MKGVFVYSVSSILTVCFLPSVAAQESLLNSQVVMNYAGESSTGNYHFSYAGESSDLHKIGIYKQVVASGANVSKAAYAQSETSSVNIWLNGKLIFQEVLFPFSVETPFRDDPHQGGVGSDYEIYLEKKIELKKENDLRIEVRGKNKNRVIVDVIQNAVNDVAMR